MTPVRKGPRVNQFIEADPVRLIDADGEQVGVVGLEDALSKADDGGLDLVEISPNSDPPVCKILDYGKYKYEEQKKRNEARKSKRSSRSRRSRCARCGDSWAKATGSR